MFRGLSGRSVLPETLPSLRGPALRSYAVVWMISTAVATLRNAEGQVRTHRLMRRAANVQGAESNRSLDIAMR